MVLIFKSFERFLSTIELEKFATIQNSEFQFDRVMTQSSRSDVPLSSRLFVCVEEIYTLHFLFDFSILFWFTYRAEINR